MIVPEPPSAITHYFKISLSLISETMKTWSTSEDVSPHSDGFHFKGGSIAVPKQIHKICRWFFRFGLVLCMV